MKTKHPHRGAPSRGLQFESLESRLLLSADLLPAADVLATEPSLVPAEHRALAAFDPAPNVSMRLEAHELVFVDGSIADRDRLLADFMRATGPDRAIEVVVLDPSRDGIAQIGEALAARKGLTAVHVLSHGRDGAIDLGATTLDAATLAARADAVAGWAGAFAADGDLLLFGCDVADTVRGEGFLGELARLTGADVAASDDRTGDVARGGDWDLEFATGAIDAGLAPLAEAAWGGLLATEVLDWDDGAVDWPDGSVGSNSYAVGGANVTVTVTDPDGQLNNGSPADDALNDEGGLGAIEQGLYVSSNGFDPGQSSMITIGFAHPGGVSNVSFTIFDIDRGDVGDFIDEIQASFTASGAVTLSILNGPSNTVIGGDTVQGVVTTPSTGAGSGDANATFTFTGSGITQISLNYRNAGGATGQSITLHDISFDPTPTASDRTVTTNEDATRTFAAADFGFADVGGDTLQAVRITQLETAGSLQLNGVDVVLNQVVSIADINANLLTFAPAANASGAPYANFRFRVSDGVTFSVADYQMRVDVTPLNDAPVLAGANNFAAIAEDLVANTGTAVSALIAAQLADVDAGALAGIAVTAVDNANGAWEYSTDGGTSWNPFVAPTVAAGRLLRDSDLVRFVPAADWNGAATMSFRGWDRTSGAPGGTADTNANGGTTAFSLAVRTSSIAVTAVGDTVNDAAGTNEDVPVTVDVLANDNFENPGRTLTAVAGAANGAVGFTAAGAITYTPSLHWNGSETLTYTITSGGVTETGTLTITIAAVNDAPTLAVGANQTVAEDAAAQTVVGFATAAPGGGADEAGQTFTYAVTNDKNTLFVVQPSIAANGTLTYTLAPDAHGTANLTVTVADSGGVLNGGVDTSAASAFIITATPVADTPSITNAATLEDIQTAGGLVISRNAADGAEVTHFRITGIAGGTLSLNDGATIVANGTFITAAEGSAGLRFTPGVNSIAAGSFDVQASTAANVAGLGGGVITASIAVTAVNDAPTLAIGANQTIAEDAAAQTVAGFATAAPGGGADEAGQTFTYTVTNDNNTLFAVQPSIAANGTLTYTLAPDAYGTANVAVSLTDSGGTLNAGVDMIGPLGFTVTATPVADTPSVTNAATLEDAQTTAGLAISRNPADGAEVTHLQITGIAGGTLFLNDGTTSVSNGAFITAAAGAAGLKFTPAANSVASGGFDVQASTAANATGLAGGVVTAVITVTPVNDEPSFTIGANQTVAEDAAAQTVVAFATAAPGGGPDEAGQTFTYTVTNDNNTLFAVQPSIAANGTLTYTLAPDAYGAANVTVSVTDSGGTFGGGDDTAPVQAFTITATPVLDTPSVTNAATLEDVQTGGGLVISRNAADGAEVTHFRITSIAGGALFLNDGATIVANGTFITAAEGSAGLKFTPGVNSIAAGSFDVQASIAANVAGLGGSVITASIGVTAVNDAPTLAIGANQTVAEDAAAQTVAGFATAAPGGGPDEAGQTFTYTVTNDNNPLFAVQPSIAANGTLTYMLAPDAYGVANVTVSVSDSGGVLNGGFDTSGASVFTITATPVADTPSVTNAATLEDTQTTVGLVISRNAADGIEVTHFQITGITGGTLFLSDGTTSVANGAFITAAAGAAGLKFTPGPNAVAPGSFDVQASTAASATGVAGGVVTAAITVTPVNDEPSFTIGANQTVAEDAAAQTVVAFTTAAPGGGPDEAGQTFTYTVTNDNNTLFAVQPAVAANGTLTYTLAANASGAATLTLFVADSGGALNGGDDAAPAQIFTITATPVADAPTLTVNPATGNEDTAIGLNAATALVDADGSETLAVTVSSIPVGATLTDGANTFTATTGNTTATITGWNLAQLRITPPANSDVDFTLAVAATATEGANGAAATTNANLAVTVDAVADAPTLNVNPAAGNEDTAIVLPVATALVDTDGSETLSIAMSAIPIGAVITDGVNTFTASAGNQAANVTGWNLAALTITPPVNADTDFTLTLTATATEGANGSVAASVTGLLVDVLPVNDAPTVAAPAALDVVEDVPSPLLGISFADVDAGTGLVTATFTAAQGTLSATAGGGVAVGGTATARTLTGTLAAINAFLAGGGLGYTTVLDSNAPVALTASLDDLGNTGAGGPLASPNANVTLNVIPVNDAPVLGGVALEIDAGGTVVLTGANMSATDVDDTPPSLVFFIAGLQNGRFELAGNPGVPVLAFTQAQVTAGQVKFVHTDPLFPPSYLVFVTDGASTVGPGIVALTFRPLVVPGGASKGAPDDGTLPALRFAAGTLDTSQHGLSDPFAIRFNRQAVVSTDDGGAPVAEAEPPLAAAGSRQSLATPGTVWELRSRGIVYPDLGFGEMDRLATNIPPLDFGIGPQRPHEEPRGLTLALEAVRTAGLVVSVGAVWWASRAAGLVSSLLAITPTWRHIDPMPVLGRDHDDETGSWDDPVSEEAAKEDASANEMFDGKTKQPPSA